MKSKHLLELCAPTHSNSPWRGLACLFPSRSVSKGSITHYICWRLPWLASLHSKFVCELTNWLLYTQWQWNHSKWCDYMLDLAFCCRNMSNGRRTLMCAREIQYGRNCWNFIHFPSYFFLLFILLASCIVVSVLTMRNAGGWNANSEKNIKFTINQSYDPIW